MNVAYSFLVLVLLVCAVVGDFENITENAYTVQDEISTTPNPSFGTRGVYGGSYYNNDADNPDNIHYIHGAFRPPQRDYYKSQRYYREDDAEETFDYYLGFAISRMTDRDFHYSDFHYYFHDMNRTINDNDTIPSDVVIGCHPDSVTLCPENSETVCLINGTIYCMSKLSVVVPCTFGDLECVTTTVPCVRKCIAHWNDFETISLPCLANVVIEDVYEFGDRKTISRVGGTFVVVDALTEAERTYCVTAIIDPDSRN